MANTELNGVQGHTLSLESLSENIKKTQYAVRGELYLAGQELSKQGKKIVFTNLGNPHALGQKPLTFPRQVLALCEAPFLLDNPNVDLLFPTDAIQRAHAYLKMIPSGLGAYSDSRGVPGIREEVASYIGQRDGHKSDPNLIYLTDGASPGVKLALTLLLRGPQDGLLCPVPQYPLYSATVQFLGGQLVPYYLDESNGWGLDMPKLEETLNESRSKGLNVRGMVLINPGNPTGQCLTEENLREVVRFCIRERIVLLADEVYQDNIYNPTKPFVSCRKVLLDLPAPERDALELFSFHTVSKGMTGECGLRGGYFEMVNIDPEVVEQIYKVCSIGLCPNTTGQIMVGLTVNPPKPGDASYERHVAERQTLLESFKRRAATMASAFQECKNMTCNPTEGALYVFPQLHFPPAAIKAAEAAGKAPDAFYCLELLKAAGVLTVPGSGFGQEKGTFHFRTTILPKEEEVPEIMKKVQAFNDEFMSKYSSESAS